MFMSPFLICVLAACGGGVAYGRHLPACKVVSRPTARIFPQDKLPEHYGTTPI